MQPITPIPTRALILCEDFGERLDARRVGEALCAGLLQGGAPEPDVLALLGVPARADGQRALLDGGSFDPRLRAARALVIAVASLQEGTLAGSVAFEAATRARQGGVPAYAVTARNALDTFDVRILDLQAVIEGASARLLRAAGRRLAAVI